MAEMRLREKIRAELFEDNSVVLSGRRLVNRPGSAEKSEFIEASIRRGDVDHFPFVESDIDDEFQVAWAWELDPKTSPQAILASEIEKAFELAGETPPVISNVHALTILSSEVELKISTLGDLASSSIELPLVLAHVLSLGFGWSERVTIAVARRATVVLMNKHLWQAEWRRHLAESIGQPQAQVIISQGDTTP